MATAPTNATAPKTKRKSGPRVVKDKVMYALYKGQLDSLEFVFTADAALEAKEFDDTVKYKTIVIPGKAKPRAPVAVDPAA